MIDKDQLTRLKELAEKATQEPWDALQCYGDEFENYIGPDSWVDDGKWIAAFRYAKDARYIAAAQPATILGLIAEIERLEKQSRLEEGIKRLLGSMDMAQGTLFSRFNNPDYSPMQEDMDEAMKRVNGLIEAYARLAEAYSDLEKEADWLAGLVAEQCKGEISVERIRDAAKMLSKVQS